MPRRAPHARPAAGGFSLIELLAVITILGLMAGIVSVSWAARLPQAELNSTVHDIAAAVSGARSDAIARNGEFRIYYDLDNESYKVVSPYRLGGGLAQTEEERVVVKRVNLPDSIDLRRVTIDGVRYDEGVVFVTFDPLGSATGHTLQLVQQPSEMPMTVEVLPLTGLIRFHYQEYERPVVSEEDFD